MSRGHEVLDSRRHDGGAGPENRRPPQQRAGGEGRAAKIGEVFLHSLSGLCHDTQNPRNIVIEGFGLFGLVVVVAT